MAPPEPGLAAEIARVHRLETADVISWWEAAELIAGLTGGGRGVVHALSRRPLIDLQARLLQLIEPHDWAVRAAPAPPPPLPMHRDQLVAAILDRVS